MTFAYALMVASRGKTKIKMLDWGGALGHYYLLSRSILPDVEIKYVCKELSFLCEHGRKLLPDVEFYDNDNYLNYTYDFSLFSGSLQYVEDWKKVFSDVRKATDGYIFVTILPVVMNSPSFVVLERGYSGEFLEWIFNKQEFLKYAQEIGLDLVQEFLISYKVYAHRAQEPFDYRGFLFRTAPVNFDLLKN